ncbi:MAG: GIY-YIG nuclease family protein [Bacteroidales bacterium]|jgi:hypothetical protein|nr:GIY-YIG nuclease family protein [Bacteroidales bacterium]
MKARPQTIQIFLPDGNPRGVRIAEITNRTVKAILFPRNQFEYVLTRNELSNVGFYFLFGESEVGKSLVYIGEAEDCAVRLSQHHRKKDFWNYGIVIISKINAFTKTHVKYLEHVAIKTTQDVNRWQLENGVNTTMPFVTESMEADMLDCFETTKVLLSTLGFPLFDSISRDNNRVSHDIYKMKSKEAFAEGNLIDDGFVVYKGSKAVKDTLPSCHKYMIDLRNKLIDSGTLSLDGNVYVFTEDYIFSSPSTAGGVVSGRPTNGWKTWKNMNGKTLDEIKRENLV